MPNAPRRALIVNEAAGAPDAANQLIARFGFPAALAEPSVAAALARLGSEHFDLVIVPVDDFGEGELATLERALPHDGTTAVIGVARQADSPLVLRALRAGMQEFVTHPADGKELSAAIERLMKRRAAREAPGLTIVSYSPKGGMGTSTVAVNVAYALAMRDARSRAAIADFVAVGGDLRVLLDLRSSYDIGDVASKIARLDASLLLSLLSHPSDRVWALPSSDRVEVADLIDGAGATAILAQLRSQFRYVVVDTEHHLGERTLAALDVADHILLVTQLTVPSLRSTQAAMRLFSRLGYAPQKVHVVLNRFDADETLSAKDAVEVLGHDVFWKLPNDFHACAGALTHGKPVVVHKPDSKLARSFVRLASVLAGDHQAGNGTDGNEKEAAPGDRQRNGGFLRLGRK